MIDVPCCNLLMGFTVKYLLHRTREDLSSDAAGVKVGVDFDAVFLQHQTLDPPPCLQSSHFELNAGVEGGAVRLAAESAAEIHESVFVANMAARGSAILVDEGATLGTLKGCTFFNNTQLIEYASVEDSYATVQPVKVYSAYAVDVYAKRCAWAAPLCCRTAVHSHHS